MNKRTLRKKSGNRGVWCANRAGRLNRTATPAAQPSASAHILIVDVCAGTVYVAGAGVRTKI